MCHSENKNPEQKYICDASAGLLKSFHPSSVTCHGGPTINAFLNLPAQSVNMSFPKGVCDLNHKLSPKFTPERATCC